MRRLAAAATATALVGAGLALTAAPAQADANMTFSCKILSSSIPWNAAVKVTLAPSSPKAGQTTQATVSFPQGYKTGPVTVPPNKTDAKIFVNINGANKSKLGTPNPKVLPPNSPFTFAPITVSFKAKSGSNTIKLTKVEFRYLDNGPNGPDTNTGLDTICTPTSATTIATFTASGAASSSNSSGGGTATKTKTCTTNGAATGSTTACTTGGSVTTASGAIDVQTNTGATTAQQPAAQPRTRLPKTGPEDAWRSGVVALVALQLGLILAVRMSRKSRRKAVAR